MSALADAAFTATLRRFTQTGNATERDLARIALDLYEITKEHPGVIHYINRKTEEVLR